MTSWCHKPPCDIQLEEEINRAEFNVHTSSSFEGVKAHVLADKILLRKIRFVYSELTYITRVVIYIFKAIFSVCLYSIYLYFNSSETTRHTNIKLGVINHFSKLSVTREVVTSWGCYNQT